ncbi:putative polysaccharide lyase family 8, N terminal alpha-helical domain [Lyophyllum shimeji]|uniref:Polysaccharide lyase family 8, N terminal alpha-helical domain n=1 Tax=Lyophyllum shimeji TaxID=47721 RepID=A0A9P3PHR6_LYOSH|nr:putative polysaccharide lyase family 8, N terminal alpha-helical domain [Lyophyllum shimeji]
MHNSPGQRNSQYEVRPCFSKSQLYVRLLRHLKWCRLYFHTVDWLHQYSGVNCRLLVRWDLTLFPDQQLKDIETIRFRRLSTIVGELSGSTGNISAWLLSLGPNGKWPDSEVDYATGCAARRANWPAQDHWQRIVVMAAAWHGGLQGAEQFVKDNVTRAAISRAMDYWFLRDLTNIACLDSGGTALCPCTNADNSLWNTNWFSNIILIPDLVGRSCVLLEDTLTPTEGMSCSRITGRAYNTFDKNINGLGFLTGANTLDVAAIGIDLALLTVNATLLADAYRRIHLELSIRDGVKADGIRPDGSFGQHGGILYNGNYGKDYINDILDVEIEAAGTEFAANSTSQTALTTLFDGSRWMIYRNAVTGVLHWDFSALGRFISFPVIDNQATGSIKINLTQVRELGQLWSSSSMIDFADSLSQSTTNANAGRLKGNRMFYANDYMVHRGHNYVSTVKMFSSRTQNTECVNSQNPLGFHLADGAVHTYVRGDEYEDISVAWDWNLIPGTTVDYGATPLSCGRAQFTGTEGFVGGTSDGDIGLAVMRYTNPFTRSLRWQKVWFFLHNDVQHVMIANVSSTTSAPVYTVLDQRRRSGPVVTDEGTIRGSLVQTLWHGGVGYIFRNNNATTMSIHVGEKSGNWSAIGTSTQPSATVNLFGAWTQHTSPATPVSYTVLPGTDQGAFATKSKELRLQSVRNDSHVSAVFDEVHNTAMAVFWDGVGGSITFRPPGKAPITISTNGNLAIIYKLNSGEVVVSDPSQTLVAVQVSIGIGAGLKPPHWGKASTKSMIFALPQGGLAGSSVSQTIQ